MVGVGGGGREGVGAGRGGGGREGGWVGESELRIKGTDSSCHKISLIQKFLLRT